MPSRRPAVGLMTASLVVAVTTVLAGCSSGNGGTSWLGADPAAVGAAAGCDGATNAQQSAPGAPVQYRTVLCALGDKPVSIQTYSSLSDQKDAEQKALVALGASLPKGTYYYASGKGWLAEDSSVYAKDTAQQLVDKLGGSVKSFQGQK